jgi:release factor glutamine methyltransferase
MVDRRASGLPLEQVIGWAEFCALRVAVEPGVFIPRRRSELLVRRAAALAPRLTGATSRRTVVVDLCCGSGALGAALAAAVGPVELHASDIEPAAVRCARRNVVPFAGRVYQGDLFDPLPATLRGRVDVLLANAPYVPTEGIDLLPPEARDHEPRVALDGGADGLDVLRRVVGEAPRWLAPGGHVFVEASGGQTPPIAEVMSHAGLIPQVVSDSELNATIVVGTMPPR